VPVADEDLVILNCVRDVHIRERIAVEITRHGTM
jgi:hypothetical protein